MSETTPIAIERAWRLSAAHAHHWAGCWKCLGPWAEAIEEEDADYQRRLNASGPWITGPRDPYALAESLALGTQCSCREDTRWCGVPPRTLEQARLLGRLPAGELGGQTICLDDDGSIIHVTGTGRVEWTIQPDGHTLIEICRPTPGRPEMSWEGYSVLRATLKPEDTKATIDVLADFAERHWEALTGCLRSLGAAIVVDDDTEEPLRLRLFRSA